MAKVNISGKAGTFTIGGTKFDVDNWDWMEQAGTSDATDSGTAADVMEHTIGRKTARFSFSGKIDTSNLPSGKVVAGTALATVLLTLNGTVKYAVALATVTSFTCKVPIGSGDTVSFQGEALVNGAWTPLA